jgi:hypothetical protein
MNPTRSLFFVLATICQFAQIMATIRILSTGTTGGICENEFMYGTPNYIEKFRELLQQIVEVESGYENMRLFPISPTHLGCKQLDLEVVVLSPSSLNIPEQEYLDLAEDLQFNLFEEVDVKLIIIDNHNQLAPHIRSRMVNAHAVHHEPSFIQRELSVTLNQVASELQVQITNIEFNPRDITVTLAATHESRRMQNRFILLARARTRRIIRVN